MARTCVAPATSGLFKIVSEGGVAAGVRRIEAVTGQGAYDYVVQTDHKLRDVAGLVRGSRDDVEEKVRQLIERARRLEKELAQLKDKLASGSGRDLATEAVTLATARNWLQRASKVPTLRRCALRSINSRASSAVQSSCLARRPARTRLR